MNRLKLMNIGPVTRTVNVNCPLQPIDNAVRSEHYTPSACVSTRSQSIVQMSQEPHEQWAQCLLSIEQRVRPISFNTWFRPTRARRFDGESLVLEVPSAFFANYVETNYLDKIQKTVQEITSLTPKITFIVAEEEGVPPSTPVTSEPLLPIVPQMQFPSEMPAAEQILDEAVMRPSPSLNQNYTFENFVVGEGNRFAHAAAQDVAKSPGKTQFNPLVIYGGVGLGKTHLLQAIGHFALERGTAQKVTYVPSEKFLSDFIEAIGNRTQGEFRRQYRSADILLVDDIQFLIKGEVTPTEFFHTFNALHQNSKLIAMTCDSPPDQLEGLEERLISRFQWGLVTRIGPPDLETRIAILMQKAEISGISLPEDVAIFLGNFISSNIRELEGALTHLMAYCSVNQRELSVEAARQIVQERAPIQESQLGIEAIQLEVAEHFGLSCETLIAKTRKKEVANARQIAMFLAKRLTKYPLKTIGLHFGKRDHSTVIHAIHTVEKRSESDSSFAHEVEALSEAIQHKHTPA